MNTISPSLAELELGFIARLEDDSAFSALTSIVRGWPKKLLDKPTAADLPLVSLFTPGRRQLSNDAPEYLEIQTDVWVWPAEKSGGREKLNEIDDAMLDLLGDDGSAITFSYTRTVDAIEQTFWMSCVCDDASDPVESVLRRRRLWQVAPA